MLSNTENPGKKRDQKGPFRFRKYPLRIKLLFSLIIFSTVATMIMAWVSILNASASLDEALQESLESASAQTAILIDKFFYEVINAVEKDSQQTILSEYLSLPSEMQTDDALDRVDKTFREIIGSSLRSGADDRLGALDGYLLLDRNGKVLLSSEQASLGKSLASEEYFTVPLKNPQTYVSSIHFDSRGQPVFYLGRRVYNTRNEVAGVLLERYRGSIFQRLIEGNKNLVGSGSYAILVDENGLRLGQGSVSESLYRYIQPLPEGKLAELDQTGYFPASDLSEDYDRNYLSQELQDLGLQLSKLGDPTLFSFRLGEEQEIYQAATTKLSSLSEPWKIFYVQSEEELYAPFRKTVRRTGWVAFLVVLIASLTAIPLSNALSAPVRRLLAAINSNPSEILKERASIETGDEFEILENAISQMTIELQQNMVNLEQRVSERTHDLEKKSIQLQAVAEIGRAAATIRNIDELLSSITRLISERFGFYHAGIFLLEDQNVSGAYRSNEKGIRFAVLRAANSEGGQRMLARGHKLRVGQQGIVGYVAGTGNPRIALDVGEDSQFFNNPDLPETRSEMALALSIGGKMIGVLDVQSTHPNAFTRDDVAVMQTLADLIAIAIENARLFTESSEALETSRRAYGELSRKAWMEIVNSKDNMSYTSLDIPYIGENPNQGHLLPVRNVDEKGGDMEMSAPDSDYSLSLPIKVRETVIGYLDTYKPKDSGGWTPDEYDMVTTIIEQLGVALESARLYESSQNQAERERLIGEMASRMRESLNVDAVLRTAVQELRQSLGISQVEVRLKPSQQDE